MRRVEKARANVLQIRLWPGGSKFDMVGWTPKFAFRIAIASSHSGAWAIEAEKRLGSRKTSSTSWCRVTSHMSIGSQ